MASPDHRTKGRRLFRRRAHAGLPPVSLTPDEWIASLVSAPPGSMPAEHGSSASSGNGHANVVAVMAPPTAEPSAVPAGAPEPVRRPRGKRRVWRGMIGTFLVLALAAAGAVAAVSYRDRLVAQDRLADIQDRLAALQDRIAAITTERDALRSQSEANQPRLLQLESELAKANAEVQKLRDTVQQEKAAAAAATSALVPNGKDVTVEVTGYEGVIQIHDVHLTQAYGFSDLIGIAVNQSGEEIAYAQLGCTLLDAKGRVLANVIDNREHWPAGASWGFDCTAEVDATGGIVRVDAAS